MCSIMIKREDPAPQCVLTPRQRMTLVNGTSVSHQTAAEMDDAGFDFAFFQRHGVRSRNIKVAGLGPVQLKERGVENATALRALGFSTIDLVDGTLCASCVSAFGAADVVSAFLVDASDAVVLAGSPAMFQLDLDISTLLMVCAGCPTQAEAVVAQTHPRGACLGKVTPETLLDTGLRNKQLTNLGFTRESIQAQTRASREQLAKLGY